MTGIILCFDDTPTRFGQFYRLATARGLIPIVTADKAYARIMLASRSIPVVGVCLDFNVPGVDMEAFTKTHLSSFAGPVAIVSNDVVGARKLDAVLGSRSHRAMPAEIGDAEWATSVLDWFEARFSEKMEQAFAAL